MKQLLWISLILFTIPQLAVGQTVLGTANWEEANAILSLPDNSLIITGKCRLSPQKDFDLFVLHLTAEGNVISAQTYGGPFQDEGLWLEPTKDGGFIVAGYSFGKEGGFGRHDIYLLKFSAQVELEWERLHGRAFREIPFRVRETDFGYLIGGYTKSQGLHGDYMMLAIDAHGNALWDHYYEAPYVDIGHDIAITKDGFLIVGSTAGYHFPSQANHHYPQSNIMVIRTDMQGVEIERRFFGGERHEFARSIVSAPGDAGWYILGSTQNEISGDFDFLLLHLNKELNEVWSKSYGGNQCDQGSMVRRMDENLLLYGTFEEDGKYKGGFIKVNANGDELEKGKIELNAESFGTSIQWIGGSRFVGTGNVIKSELDRDIFLFTGQTP